MIKKLKPCPFCGKKATTAKTYIPKTGFMVYYVGCYSQNCQINPCANVQNSELSDVGWNKSVRFMTKRLREEAVNAWNKRGLA